MRFVQEIRGSRVYDGRSKIPFDRTTAKPHKVQRAKTNIAAQMRAESSTATKKPTARSLMLSSSGNPHCLQETFPGELLFRYARFAFMRVG